MTQTYHFHGLKLESEFHLPALAAWQGPSHARSHIVVRKASVPPHLDCPDHVAPVFQTKGSTEYLLTLPGTGRILVRNGNEVLVDAEPDADASAILGGPLQAVLWHQRGLLPLHGSAVAVGAHVIALCGHSGAGKSTLAAHLGARGYPVIADDVCVIDPEQAVVLPGSGQLRLWRDALDRLGLDTATLQRAARNKEKYFFDCGSRGRKDRYRLAAVILLSSRSSSAVTIERLRGASAAGALYEMVHMRRPADALARAHGIFAGLTRLAAAGVTVWRLKFCHGTTSLNEAATVARGVVEA